MKHLKTYEFFNQPEKDDDFAQEILEGLEKYGITNEVVNNGWKVTGECVKLVRPFKKLKNLIYKTCTLKD